MNKTEKTKLLVSAWKITLDGVVRRKIENLIIKEHEGFYRSAVKVDVRFCDKDDLLNEVRMTLVDALRDYDESRGVTFLTYWAYKMHGAVSVFWRDYVKHKNNSLDKELSEDFYMKDLIGGKDKEYEFDVKNIINRCKTLNEKEQELLIDFFKYGFRLGIFAQRWGVSKQAVSQLKIKALAKMRAFFLSEKVQIGLFN